MKVEHKDLKPGTVYRQEYKGESKYITRYTGINDEMYIDLSRKEFKYDGHTTDYIDNFIATDDELAWYEECVAKREYIPKEIALVSSYPIF